ncbi:MAG: Ppx/GppA family phosphatase [Nitrospinaceae bacterium]|nr:Ppx/GppA family phosphatase [Nitrospinaceae bacterium]NIR53596.1 Ppx/GppA family phosphatase [Nitrospinaceae bacterium]NIS83999.1 Ppx/GppA family phosphatase [Nitrospinaceae bacterium]NIT84608.1 Ppx/GppA family phosphatase [Nitrospinaceae bacterium]NIU43112.1 Ppx/GppA family phosphatase [Nitrospinaceae bacterium]
MEQLASIDIGSNTVRLLIMERGEDGQFREVDSRRVICRLGEGMNTEQRLLPHRMELTLKVLGEFQEQCRKHGDIPVRCVATSAVREAANRQEFVRRAQERFGLTVEVISWEEEARLTLEGVFWRLPVTGKPTLVFDIGGGSTEFILAQGREVLATAGTGLGVVRLTEQFISRHPVDPEEHLNMKTWIGRELNRVRAQLGNPTPEILIGTAGTVTTLAAMDRNIFPYDPEKVHGLTLPRQNIEAILDDLKSKSLAERLEIQTLERGREDLIIAGTTLVLETMRAFDCPLLTVSEYSLREGILLSGARR